MGSFQALKDKYITKNKLVEENVMEDLSLTSLSMKFAKMKLPDEETPIDCRSVFPPGEVSKDLNYKCLQILVAVAFEKGFLYRIQHVDEENPTHACEEYASTIYKDKPDDNKSKILMKWAFASGIICFDDKEIKVNGKILKIDFDKDTLIKQYEIET